ncbi:hypothetical protein FF1_034851 [Malus domestica]
MGMPCGITDMKRYEKYGEARDDIRYDMIGFILANIKSLLIPRGISFGDCSSDVPQNFTFKRGHGMVTVTFWSACPQNDLMTEGTFALVEILHGKDTWLPAYDDNDFYLCFKWSRPAKLSTRSQATIEWRIPQSATPGIYRIRHFGASKSFVGSIRHFTGSSSVFVVA